MRTELKQNEQLLLECKKHWLVIARAVILFFIMALATLVINTASKETPPAVKTILLALLIISLLYLVYKILDRKFDIWAVTTQRIVDESGILSHNAKESFLNSINNISYHQPLLGRIFGYGTVRIQTAAEQGATVYPLVTDPKLLKNTVTKAQEDYRQTQVREHSEQVAQTIQGGESGGDTKECPYCAEIIKAKAKLCRFCGKELT